MTFFIKKNPQTHRFQTEIMGLRLVHTAGGRFST